MKQINNISILILITLSLFSCSNKKDKPVSEAPKVAKKEIGTLEVVAEMDINPGNVAVSKEGRIFTSIHPMRPNDIQLVEITGKTTHVPFPNEQMQSTAETKSDEVFDTPLGLIFDDQNRLWVLDAGFNIGQTRLYAYDIDTKKELLRFDIPQEFAPNTSFVQDIAVDAKNGFVYLADVFNPGIVVVDINKNEFRKIIDLPSMQSEDADMVIDGKVQYLNGKPARIALDPITISADKEILYYGAMNGKKWYQLPTRGIRNGVDNNELIKQISVVAEKPFSDGADTDDEGNHYFTNIQNYSIDVLSKDGKLSTLKKDPFLDWPDNVRINGDWLYIAVSQVHKTPAFNNDKELGTPPYRILKLKFK